MTDEHVFPEWMREVLPPAKNRHYQGLPKTHISAKGIRVERDGRWLQRSLGTWQVPIVCGTCNNGWMSRLQTGAQHVLTRMIRGDRVRLEDVERNALIAWIAMTTIVSEFTDRRTVLIDEADRQELYDFATNGSQLLLDGWLIAIGNYVGTEALPLAHRHYVHARLEGMCPSQTTSIRIGELFIVVWTGLDLTLRDALQRSLGTGHGLSFLMRDAGPIDWPPPLMIHDELADTISFYVRDRYTKAIQLRLENDELRHSTS